MAAGSVAREQQEPEPGHVHLNLNSRPCGAVPGWHLPRAPQPTCTSGSLLLHDQRQRRHHGHGPSGGTGAGAGPGRARGLPEDVEPAAIQAVLQPVFLPQGTFGLRNARAMRVEKAKATVMEFVENINHSAIPGEIRAGTASRGFCARKARRTRRS